MKKADEHAAGVPFDPKLYSFLLRNWRHFSRDFAFSPRRISGAWQSLFDISIPDDVEIIARPDIQAFREKDEGYKE